VSGSRDGTRPRLYLAEDSKSQRLYLSAVLERDFEVHAFENGQLLLQAAAAVLPDVVISDIEMPVLDGLSLTRALKADPVSRPVPVILLTAGSDRGGVMACLDAGADDFLAKPAKLEELAARARSAARAFATYKDLQAHHLELAATHGRLKEAEVRARLSEERVTSIIEAADDAILTLDARGQVASMNGAAERMFGGQRGEKLAVPVAELFAPGDDRDALLQRIDAALAGAPAGPGGREATAVRRSGASFPADCAVTRADAPGGPTVCLFVRDLTEARRTEALARHAQQLEAIGGLAAGIAHEMNTPAQCIGDSLYFVQEAMEGLAPVIRAYRALVDGSETSFSELAEAARGADRDADLAYIMEQAPAAIRRALVMTRRIVDIVQATRDFARDQRTEVTSVELRSSIERVLEGCRAVYEGVASIQTDIAEMSVLCDPVDLQQALRHLVINAAQAIADSGRPGTITIRATRDRDDADIVIEDDGCGVPDDVRHRLFDPFFTTREVGKGVGLGLFIASSNARRLGGELTFESEHGRGTRFHLRLPLRSNLSDPEPSVEREPVTLDLARRIG
jgi:two-component system NtrC family sensor kinase